MYAILATISPKAGSFEEVLNLVKQVGQYAEEHEPGCVEFRVLTELNSEGLEELYTIEKFATLEDIKLHQETPALADFNKAMKERGLLEKGPVGKVVKGIYGFHI